MIKFKVADKGTCWWSNTKSKSDGRWRNDNLFGLSRHYSRTYKQYIYRIYIGRLTIGISL